MWYEILPAFAITSALVFIPHPWMYIYNRLRFNGHVRCTDSVMHSRGLRWLIGRTNIHCVIAIGSHIGFLVDFQWSTD